MAQSEGAKRQNRTNALELAIRATGPRPTSTRSAVHAEGIVEAAKKFEEFLSGSHEKEGTSGDTVGSDTPK